MSSSSDAIRRRDGVFWWPRGTQGPQATIQKANGINQKKPRGAVGGTSIWFNRAKNATPHIESAGFQGKAVKFAMVADGPAQHHTVLAFCDLE